MTIRSCLAKSEAKGTGAEGSKVSPGRRKGEPKSRSAGQNPESSPPSWSTKGKRYGATPLRAGIAPSFPLSCHNAGSAPCMWTSWGLYHHQTDVVTSSLSSTVSLGGRRRSPSRTPPPSPAPEPCWISGYPGSAFPTPSSRTGGRNLLDLSGKKCARPSAQNITPLPHTIHKPMGWWKGSTAS